MDAGPDATEDAGGQPLLGHAAFVTSEMGTGDFSTWASANGKTGLAAADAICQTRAAAAGLKGTFAAWLSDEENDAFCRVQGFAGKRSAGCGQVALPIAAGPWMSTEGLPWGGTIAQLTDPRSFHVYAPLRLTELGGRPPQDFFTNTASDGVFKGPSCARWTSATGSANYGSMSVTEDLWSAAQGTSTCGTPHTLACLAVGLGPTLSFPKRSGKVVFLSSVMGTGDLSSWVDAGGKTGVAAGDAICQARALAAGLAGTFKAWLHDGANAAGVRFTSAGPWIRLDGMKLAETKTELSAALRTTPNLTELGSYRATTQVWTGESGATCGVWTMGTNAAMGTLGRAWSVTAWSNAVDFACSYTGRLYCLED